MEKKQNLWFHKSVDETKEYFKLDEENGLSNEQVNENRQKYGTNELQTKKKKSTFVKFLEQFKDFMIIVLIIAAIISGVVGYIEGEGITDSIIILIVVILNAVIGVIQENKAEKSLEALQKLSAHVSKVIRNGKMEVIPAKELVPGDIVVLDTGDYVPADLRIIEAVNLKSQEASLTGESVPVEKSANTIEQEEVDLGDRENMLFSSSLITYGRGKGIVVETGMNTEVGKIAGIINSAEETQTPLQEKLNKLGKTLGIAALVICAIIFVIGLLYGKDPIEMFMTAVSLAVAVIPEGLAAVSTIVLAIGVQRMVKRHAIVKKLPAVETLGSTTVICSDKTGTLTQNKMTVEKIFYNGKLLDAKEVKQNIDKNLEKLVYISMLCNDTKISANNELTGDPTETALVDMGFNLQFEKNIYDKNPRIKEIPFDSDRKLMTTVNKINDKYVVLTKGGVDELLARCNKYLYDGEERNDLENYKKVITKNNENMAKDALRVLSMAYKEIDHEPTDEEMKDIEQDLIYVGMVGMIDPPRLEVKDAVDKCKKAGIKTVMITGDHKITAIAIAKSLGILQSEEEALTGAELEKMSDEDLTKNIRKYSVYARVSPEHKVRIVKAWQANGEIVAMTGDGVNDAPALKTADIGCAMGIVGTDVSKEAADVILTDDNFATIVSSVEEGRRIYDNILKAIQFLLSSNVGEVITLFVAILITPLLGNLFGIDINLIVPLLPIHILWINLVTDSLPALALAVDPPQKDVMDRKPNKNKSVFTKGMIWRIVYQGILIGVITIVAFIVGLATPDENLPVIEGLTNEEIKVEIGQTMAFCVLAFSQLVHVFNVRDNKTSIFKTGIFSNKQLILAVLASAALMLGILLIPALRHVFSIPVLPVGNILEIVVLSLMPLIVVELFKLIKINTSKSEKL
ncbi:calcium-translocating P-type ATPase PMCA-type [Clostridium sp. CAG:273]|nr:calcium-translocating P-type ATPase, PMCA-type [Clostridia bacterium]CDE83009.1 calcium-translocating P-type ATPase PMCA-type [Clostridium sp. CAG:273]